MAICNRDNGLSQQREVLHSKVVGTVTGTSYALNVIPYPCAVQAVFAAAYGLSGTPQLAFNVHRWIGTAATVIALGISNLVVSAAAGVSGGAQGWSGLRTLGSTLLQLQAGDVLSVTSSGTNAAAGEASIAVVVQKTQDIVQHFGLST